VAESLANEGSGEDRNVGAPGAVPRCDPGERNFRNSLGSSPAPDVKLGL